MCLIVLAHRPEGPYRLVVSANRDEFYDRPAAAMGFWPDAPHVLAGRDLRGGGTWLGITTTGRFGAITNYRDPAAFKAGAPSRGHLVSSFLKGDQHPATFLDELARRADAFNGFNLLVGNGRDLFYYSNRGDRPRGLTAGIYGMSNHLLNSPWPKVVKAVNGLAHLMKKTEPFDPEPFFALLADGTPAPDEQLPDTGVGVAWERVLSPIFIQSPGYGTRCATVLVWRQNGQISVWERTVEPRPAGGSPRHFCISTRAPAARQDG
jgi:uncharacterized protein with NRDE domain